ncbi:MAG: sialidase family protein [Victivallales bacterium]|jgi:hypothetical protein
MKFTELRYQYPATRTYLGSPSVLRLDDSRILATHDYFGPGCPRNHENEEHLTSVYRSEDDGMTWENITHVSNCYWSSLFSLGKSVYLIGTSQQYGSIVLRRSDDHGNTWTHPKDENTGLLFPGGRFREPPNYHCAPVPILIRNGRLYRAFEDFVPTTRNTGWMASDFLSCVISCPVDADLLRRDSWTMSNKLRFDPAWVPKRWGNLECPGWLEGNVLTHPDGGLCNILRFHSAPLWDRAAMIRLSDDGRFLSFDPATGFMDFPGGMTKFTIRYDERTRLYFTVSNGNLEHGSPTNRSVLSMYCSADLRSWRHLTVLLQDDSGFSPEEAFRRTGFQYADWQFSGGDIIFLVRTAYDGAHNFHDSNRITYHRIRDFRRMIGTGVPTPNQ